MVIDLKVGDVVFMTSLRTWSPDFQASYSAPKGSAFAVLVLGDINKKELDSFDPEQALSRLGWDVRPG